VTDFQNTFTDTFSRKFAMRRPNKVPPHLSCVATLPCEMTVSGVYCCSWVWWLHGRRVRLEQRVSQTTQTSTTADERHRAQDHATSQGSFVRRSRF